MVFKKFEKGISTENIEPGREVLKEEIRQKEEARPEFIQSLDRLSSEISSIQEEISKFKEKKHSPEENKALIESLSPRINAIERIFRESLNEKYIYQEIVYNEIPYDLKRNLYGTVGVIKLKIEGISRTLETCYPSYQESQRVLNEREETVKKGEDELNQIKKELLNDAKAILKGYSGIMGFFKRIFSVGVKQKMKEVQDLIDYLEGKVEEFSTNKVCQYQYQEDLLKNFYRLKSLERRVQAEKIGSLKLWKQSVEREIKYIDDRTKEYLDSLQVDLEEIQKGIVELKVLKEKEMKWEKFWEEIIMKEFRISPEDEEIYKKELREQGKEFTWLDRLSFQNIRELLHDYFCGLHKIGRGYRKTLEEGEVKEKTNMEEVLESLKKEWEKVKTTRFLMLVQSQNGLIRILEEGKVRTIWDFEIKERLKITRPGVFGDPEHYLLRRKKNEEEVNIHGKNPVSCCLESKDGRYENGGPPQYGDYNLVLKDDLLERCVFSISDSMNWLGLIPPLVNEKRQLSVKYRTLNLDHALIAKAMLNDFYRNAQTGKYEYWPRLGALIEYIEARVIGGVKREDIKFIFTTEPEKSPQDLKKLLDKYKIPLRRRAYGNKK